MCYQLKRLMANLLDGNRVALKLLVRFCTQMRQECPLASEPLIEDIVCKARSRLAQDE